VPEHHGAVLDHPRVDHGKDRLSPDQRTAVPEVCRPVPRGGLRCSAQQWPLRDLFLLLRDGLERQQALAQAGDHRLAAGLDALGDGDLALAGEQLDQTHLAQIHAHGIVGALAVSFQ
jgi:hypothetical protein